MDFVRYAEASAGLLNAALPDRDALVRHLAAREWLHPSCTDRDATVLRRFQRELRPVFEASDAADVQGVIAGLNELMEKHPITPMISDHDARRPAPARRDQGRLGLPAADRRGTARPGHAGV